jgi:hypothetical protein
VRFVLENATVLIVYDDETRAQGMLAISPSGAIWLPGTPGSGSAAREIPLPELREFFMFGDGASMEAVAPIALAAIREKETAPS